MKSCFIVLLLILSGLLLAQYNERQVLMQNAYQLMSARQYTQAEAAFLQILQKYPDDQNSVVQLFNMYLTLNQNDKAEKLLRDYRNLVTGELYLQYDIRLSINKAELSDAWDKVQAYIRINPKDENRYRVMADFFNLKNFGEQAMKLYKQARKEIGNNDLFLMEAGNIAYNNRMYDQALPEYLRLVELQPANVYYIGNQIKNILKDRPELLSILQTYAAQSSVPEIKEVYAMALSNNARYADALTIYQSLTPEKLYNFANEQAAAGQDSIAIMAYTSLLDRFNDVYRLGDITIKLAELYNEQGRKAQAIQTLGRIVNFATQTPVDKYKNTMYVYQALITYAGILQQNHTAKPEVLSALSLARQYAYQPDARNDVNFRLVEAYFAYGDNQSAQDMLQQFTGTPKPDRYFYYCYLLNMSDNKVNKADSLLNELMLSVPASKYVNDMLTLNLLLLNMKPEGRTSFMQSLRNKLLSNDSLAVAQLVSLADTSKDEELRYLAAIWAVQGNLISTAIDICSYPWQDEVLATNANLLKIKLLHNPEEAQKAAQDFLKDNPNSVFSPEYRQLLNNTTYHKPSF